MINTHQTIYNTDQYATPIHQPYRFGDDAGPSVVSVVLGTAAGDCFPEVWANTRKQYVPLESTNLKMMESAEQTNRLGQKRILMGNMILDHLILDTFLQINPHVGTVCQGRDDEDNVEPDPDALEVLLINGWAMDQSPCICVSTMSVKWS